MIEDQLTRDERIRLEALNQAVHAAVIVHTRTAEDVIESAIRFEHYIKGRPQ